MDITITIKDGYQETSRTFMLGALANPDWNQKVQEMVDSLQELKQE